MYNFLIVVSEQPQLQNIALVTMDIFEPNIHSDQYVIDLCEGGVIVLSRDEVKLLYAYST